MAQGPEKKVVTAIVAAIKREHPHAWVFKTHGNPYQSAGVPDLLVCVGGHLFGLEVKHARPGESLAAILRRVTPRQEVQIERLIAAGATARVVTSPEAALRVINNFLDRA